MRLLAAINLLVSAVPATLAAVAGQAASANIAGKQLTANVAGKQLSIRPYSHIRCRTSEAENNIATELYVTNRWNIPYLNEPDKICDLRPGPNGCGRISCSWNAGIHICQKNITMAVPFMCYEAAHWAQAIVNKCGSSDLVAGAAYDAEENFSVEIFHSEC